MKNKNDKWKLYHGLIEMLMLLSPEVTAETISNLWKTHAVLKEYPKPTLKVIKSIMHYINTVE